MAYLKVEKKNSSKKKVDHLQNYGMNTSDGSFRSGSTYYAVVNAVKGQNHNIDNINYIQVTAQCNVDVYTDKAHMGATSVMQIYGHNKATGANEAIYTAGIGTWTPTSEDKQKYDYVYVYAPSASASGAISSKVNSKFVNNGAYTLSYYTLEDE